MAAIPNEAVLGLIPLLDKQQIYQNYPSLFKDLLMYDTANKSNLFWFNLLNENNLMVNENNKTFLTYLFSENYKGRLDQFVQYLVLNLERIVSRLNLRTTQHWTLPPVIPSSMLEEIQIWNMNNAFKHYQTLNDTYNDKGNLFVPETLENTLPIIKPQGLLFLANILQICPDKLYYPTDNEKYPNQRAVLYNLFSLSNIDLTDNTFITQNINAFINKLPKEIDLILMKNFKNSLIPNSPSSSLLISILNMYTKIGEENQKNYDTEMNMIEKSIFDKIAKLYNRPTQDERHINTPNVICNPELNCDDYKITNTTIYTILSNYENFYTKKIVNTVNMHLCPQQIRYIFAAFPYYKNSLIELDSAQNIVLTPLNFAVTKPEKIELKNAFNFEKIKNIVTFEDYNTFINVIPLIPMNIYDLVQLSAILYENRGFSCSTVVAALLNYHLQTNYNVKAMFMLINKLTIHQQRKLNNQNICKFQPPKTAIGDISDILGFYCKSTYILENTHIAAAVEALNNLSTLQEQILYASSTNFNILSLINYYKIPSNTNIKDKIIILMLYSNAPIQLKNLIVKDFLKEFPYPLENTLHNKNSQVIPTVDTATLAENVTTHAESSIIIETCKVLTPEESDSILLYLTALYDECSGVS
ncbi:hypothetical protein MrNuV_ORF093 [Macrobrachium rosenbergii nudivirus]|nr:hypothetical protein MrNuV_ORF093 [Macrobrachium rosenbergii nudivirus]